MDLRLYEKKCIPKRQQKINTICQVPTIIFCNSKFQEKSKPNKQTTLFIPPITNVLQSENYIKQQRTVFILFNFNGEKNKTAAKMKLS